MCNRRNKPIIQGAVVLALVGGLGYTFYLYNLTLMDLEISRSEANKSLKQQESLSSQLQVVYEHRARLERSLQKEKTDHKNTKLEFSKKQNDFLLNVTRSKHEAMNRFNSLDTQYNMLKAQSKELDTDYRRLQQQYSRFSSEQTELVKQQKRNFQLYKEQKTNEIASLDEEIKALKQQVVSLRTHLKSTSEEAEQYKSSSSRAVAASQKYQETLKTLQEQLAIYKEKLKNVSVQPRHTAEAVRRTTDKAVKTEARHQDDNVLDLSHRGAPDKQEQVGRHQERLSTTETDRSDSVHRLENSRRQLPTQIKSPRDNDAEQGDMRRSPDENADDESETQDRARLRRSDDSQSDGYSRYGNVALRDTSQDTRLEDKEADPKVVSPVENNAMNKWSDILKAAQQNPHSEGERRKDAEKLTNEDLERESKDERKAADEDRTQRGKEEDAADERIGKPVVEAGRVGDRVDSQGNQLSNEGGFEGDIGYRNKGNQENWLDEKEEKEGEKELEADGLSREKMNKKIAVLEENYQERQLEAQKQLKGAQPQDVQPQEVQTQEHDARIRAAYNPKVAPIPAVQRQDTAQEHQARADADNDDEDAGNAENEQEDPDEQDPDDAEEEDGDNFPAQDSPQQQRQAHQEQLPQRDDRKYDRSLKGVDVNNEQKRQESEQP